MNYFSRRKTESVKLTKVQVSAFKLFNAEWVADRDQQTAAWEMYVEVVTRISLQPLPADQGLLREALNSIYSLFAETRRILKQHGPGVARQLAPDSITFAHIAIAVLNTILRPFLARWHPTLEAYEATRGENVSAFTHEQAWTHNAALRKELEEVRHELAIYAGLLAEAAGIEALHVERNV